MEFFKFGRKAEAEQSEEERNQMEIAALEKQREELLAQLQLNGGRATPQDSADLLKWQERLNELKGMTDHEGHQEAA